MRDDHDASTLAAPVLVTGATGNVGREVVRALHARGRAVRAGVRRMADGDQLHGTASEIVAFDFQDPDTFAAAAAGASAVFLLRPPAISRVRPTLNAFVDVAVDQGVSHVVFLSVKGADKNPIVPHHAVEEHLRASTVPWTFLRPGFFAQNLSDAYRIDIRDDDRLFVPAEEAPVAFVDVRDVAELAATALGNAGHHGKGYTLTGPEAVSFADLASMLTEVLGRPIRYERAGRQEYFKHLSQRHGLSFAHRVVQTILHVGLSYGDASEVDPTLPRLLGRPTRTMKQFIRDHANLWRRS
ncbi:MAG: NmrA family NAD(P)-binding protein [Thermoanaerobaculia bacterium]